MTPIEKKQTKIIPISASSLPFLFLEGPATDITYSNIRDLAWNDDLRASAEAMWSEYRDYCPDDDFLAQVREDFHALCWQMQLTVELKRRGFDIQKPKSEGPDICFAMNGVRHWIEAVAANRGTGPDAVPVHNDGFAHPIPEEQIILRIRSVIEDKFRKHQQWIKKGIVKPNEPFIIAVNGGKLTAADLSPGITFAEKALFPIGKMGWSVEIGTGKTSEIIHTFRDKISKRSGKEIETNPFLTDRLALVSSVIFSPHHFANSYRMNCRDFTIIHNPMATNKIPRATFQFGIERWVEEDELRGKDWRVPQTSNP